jgi:hypothetical protein
MLAIIPNTRFRPSSISFTIKPELAWPERPTAASGYSVRAASFVDQTLP